MSSKRSLELAQHCFSHICWSRQARRPGLIEGIKDPILVNGVACENKEGRNVKQPPLETGYHAPLPFRLMPGFSWEHFLIKALGHRCSSHHLRIGNLTLRQRLFQSKFPVSSPKKVISSSPGHTQVSILPRAEPQGITIWAAHYKHFGVKKKSGPTNQRDFSISCTGMRPTHGYLEFG